ncbi:hypothetical protein M0812_18245 [Anaeramoeba flamelloides]|uniref:Uncharacterized protein n=1 Tax=Anaeramoeba flamelloides TaxID=1746091 RepID=A0AAV7Z4Y4_9EUKA|nr:hypothetical protein M0812_18245 [Anaeramoeba flamelloides]
MNSLTTNQKTTIGYLKKEPTQFSAQFASVKRNQPTHKLHKSKPKSKIIIKSKKPVAYQEKLISDQFFPNKNLSQKQFQNQTRTKTRSVQSIIENNLRQNQNKDQSTKSVYAKGGDEIDTFQAYDFEKSVVHRITKPNSIRISPTKSELKEFVKKIQFLDIEVIGHLLEEKLVSDFWQENYRALCVIEYFINLNKIQFIDYFQDEEAIEIFVSLLESPKRIVKQKTNKLLKILKEMNLSQTTQTSISTNQNSLTNNNRLRQNRQSKRSLGKHAKRIQNNQKKQENSSRHRGLSVSNIKDLEKNKTQQNTSLLVDFKSKNQDQDSIHQQQYQSPTTKILEDIFNFKSNQKKEKKKIQLPNHLFNQNNNLNYQRKKFDLQQNKTMTNNQIMMMMMMTNQIMKHSHNTRQGQWQIQKQQKNINWNNQEQKFHSNMKENQTDYQKIKQNQNKNQNQKQRKFMNISNSHFDFI